MRTMLIAALALALAQPLVASTALAETPAAQLSAETFIGEWNYAPAGINVAALKLVLADPIYTDDQIKAMKLEPKAEADVLQGIAQRRANPDNEMFAKLKKQMADIESVSMTVAPTSVTIKGMPGGDKVLGYSVKSFADDKLTFQIEGRPESTVRFLDSDTAEGIEPDGRVLIVFHRVK